MEDLRAILDLWKQAQAAGDALCLVTVVRVEGSAYRKPGARMLLTKSGRRAGTVSGGCLEAEVQKKAWWLTAEGPVVKRYSTFFDDDAEIPYGLGCGGSVWLMMERGEMVDRVLGALANAAECNEPLILGAVLTGEQLGTRIIRSSQGTLWNGAASSAITVLCEHARRTRSDHWFEHDKSLFAEFAQPPQQLFLFGAGDDAQPVVRLAASLGWSVTVADTRTNLATPNRFPQARSVSVLQLGDSAGLHALNVSRDDAVVMMTHSYEQDRWLLANLLRANDVPRYIGVLGPRSRTAKLLQAANCSAEWLEHLHSPVGLDLGSHSPAEIALSIVAEVQAVVHGKLQSSRAVQPVLRIVA